MARLLGRCCSLAVVLAGCAAAKEQLSAGDVCYRFCEDGSEAFVNRRADCPESAPCGSPLEKGTLAFDSCRDGAHVCGGAQAAQTEPQKSKGLRRDSTKGGAQHQGEQVAYRELQQTVDCVADPDNMYCCELEEEMPCLMVSIVKAKDGCTIACQRRYQTLPYLCYEDYHMHFRFTQMRENCDPMNTFKWMPPTTTAASQIQAGTTVGPDRIGVASLAVRGVGGAGYALAATLAIAVVTLL